jgi:hypothetical protein
MKTNIILALTAATLLFTACKKDEPKVEPTQNEPTKESLTANLVQVGTSTHMGYTLSMFANRDLIVGYNELFFVLEDDGNNLVSDYSVTSIHAEMDMMTMSHSTPIGQIEVKNADAGFYKSNVTFIMATDSNATWALETHVNLPDGGDAQFTFNPTVSMTTPARLISFTADSVKYFLAFVEPFSPRTGSNNFSTALYKKESMMAFPPVSDAKIEIEPWMNMGDGHEHGSSNNINPSHTSYGIYTGKVNFSMSGEWNINITVKDNAGSLMLTDSKFTVTASN